jgi:hypothetical protein
MSEVDKHCAHLRRLQVSLMREINALQEGLREEEYDGIANPFEMRSIIKSLQDTLNNVTTELAKCPAEE